MIRAAKQHTPRTLRKPSNRNITQNTPNILLNGPIRYHELFCFILEYIDHQFDVEKGTYLTYPLIEKKAKETLLKALRTSPNVRNKKLLLPYVVSQHLAHPPQNNVWASC